MAVSENVSGFQQLVMAEPADGAALLVGAEHALAKAPLVQALPDHRGHVLPPRGQRRRVGELRVGRRPDLVIAIATIKLCVSGWSSTMKTGDEDGAENVKLCQ